MHNFENTIKFEVFLKIQEGMIHNFKNTKGFDAFYQNIEQFVWSKSLYGIKFVSRKREYDYDPSSMGLTIGLNLCDCTNS